MTQLAITFVLGTIAIATFMLKGKQWPTFITALLFGIYLGGTAIGISAHEGSDHFFNALAEAFNR